MNMLKAYFEWVGGTGLLKSLRNVTLNSVTLDPESLNRNLET